MKAIVYIASCALAGNLLHAPALAAPPALPAAFEAAWSRSVAARSTEGDAALAAAERSAADALWAAPPAVELSHRSDRFQDNAGRAESEVGVAWPLLLPGQRATRQSAAEAQRHLADAKLAAAKLRLAGEVREAAWSVIARRAELALAGEQEKSLRSLAEDVDRRVGAGDLARSDALAARAERLAATAAAADAAQRLAAARAQWKALTGLDEVGDATEPQATASAPHPELALAQLAEDHAREQLALVRASRSDPPELTVRYRRDTAGGGLPADKTIGFGLRIPLGTPDRNLPRERGALSQVEVARAEAERQKVRLELDAATARAAVDAAREQAAAEETRSALLRERAGLIDKSFRAGESALVDLLRANAAAAQADAALAAQRAALGLARARLNQSLGRLP